MKKLNCFIGGFVVLAFLFSCKTHAFLAKAPEPEFANQGEQEDYWAKKFFDENYKKQKIKRYYGSIQIIGEDSIKYGETLLIIDDSNEFKTIFTKGIFYPQLIGFKKLTIDDLHELSSLSHPAKIKRFEFLAWTPVVLNPIVYFFELTNIKATAHTSTSDFIKGARLTFIKQGWILV